MKSITLTANDRPQYLIQTIDFLSKNNVFGYDVMYIALEPNCEKNIEICKSINFIETKIFINKEKKGVRLNPYFVLNEVFEDGSEFNVYLEDDILISPDTLDLCNFYYDNFKNNEYLLCSFFNYMNNIEDKSKVVEWDNFVAIGFALFRSSWYIYMQPFWFDDYISKQQNIGGIGWDWSIRSVIKKYNLKTLTPCLPRSMHIGLMGTYCTPRDHRNLFGDKVYCEEYIGGFYKEGL